MNLEQLEAVEAIVEKGSFRAAAEALRRSQPALSAAIKNLEEEFGLQIFDRRAYRPKLTEKGELFYAVARKALDSAKVAAKIAHELGNQKTETKLRVAVDPLAPLPAVEWIARECARPDIPVILILDRTIWQGGTERLLNGEADLAVAPCPRNEAKIESTQFTSVALVGAVARKLVPEGQTPNADFLNRHTQILVYDRDVKEDGPGDGPKIFAPDHFTKLRLIENGFGWGRISKTELEKSKSLQPIDRRSCAPLQMDLCLLRPKHRPQGPVARAIWETFRKNRI